MAAVLAMKEASVLLNDNETARIRDTLRPRTITRRQHHSCACHQKPDLQLASQDIVTEVLFILQLLKER